MEHTKRYKEELDSHCMSGELDNVINYLMEVRRNLNQMGIKNINISSYVYKSPSPNWPYEIITEVRYTK